MKASEPLVIQEQVPFSLTWPRHLPSQWVTLRMCASPQNVQRCPVPTPPIGKGGFSPFSFHWGQLQFSVHDGGRGQEVRKCPLACRYTAEWVCSWKKKKKTIFICFLCLSKYLKRRFWDILCLCTCHVHYWGHIHPMLWPVKCRMFWMWMSLDRAFILQFPLEHLPPHFHIYIGGNDVKSRNLQIGQKTLQYHWFW